MQKIQIIDSHTGGEPTRVIVEGGPDLRGSTLAEKKVDFATRFDHIRRAVVCEPRGNDVIVGALLLPPQEAGCRAGVIFFNNTGYLGMCGHGTIGLIATLTHLGRITLGVHKIETPVGTVMTTLHTDGRVSVRNVPAYRTHKNFTVMVPEIGEVTGDIAWGGNWFFLVSLINTSPCEIVVSNANALTAHSEAIRLALNATPEGALVDHVELFSAPHDPNNHSRNFVLCPGGAYDRSPCGTGTSAKLACLVGDGKLLEGQTWRQESVVGSVFSGEVEIIDSQIYPTITAEAFITAEATLLLDPNDPLCYGITNMF
jgi:4-hydroxyproline epimerase